MSQIFLDSQERIYPLSGCIPLDAQPFAQPHTHVVGYLPRRNQFRGGDANGKPRVG